MTGWRGRGASHQSEGDDAAEPLLEAEHSGAEHRVDIQGLSRVSGSRASADGERDGEGDGTPRHHRTPGAIRLTRRVSTQDGHIAAAGMPAGGDHDFALALKEPEGGEEREDTVREVEVEVLTEAVAEAVAEAVQEAVADAVNEAVHDAVVQAIEDNVHFDVRANLWTLLAVTGVVLFWRGVWNTWDYLFGLSIWSEIACISVGLFIMMLIRITNVPLAQGLPGG